MLRTSVPVLVVIGVLVLFVWPWGNRNSTDLRDRYQQRSDLSRVAPGVFQVSRDGSRVFFVERESNDGVNARNVFILANQGTREAVTSARSGRIEPQADERWLVLDHGQRNEIDSASGEKSMATFETYRVLANDRTVQRAEDRPPRAQRTIDLLRAPTQPAQGELTWRFGLLLGAANLLLLALGLSATNPRRASNWNLLFALLGFVVYFNLINLSQAWVSGGRFTMGTALAGLHGAVFALAVFLMWWRDRANVSRRRSRAAAA